MENPIVDKNYFLEKFPGKGGWVYTVIEEIPQDKKAKFGWVQVSGFIDTFELKNYKLMPMGNGKLFLPVRAEIRKAIKKKEGDFVHVKLWIDNSSPIFPEEIINCLKDEPQAYSTFLTFTDSEQKAYIDWITSSKKEETKVERIITTINKLLKNQKLYD